MKRTILLLLTGAVLFCAVGASALAYDENYDLNTVSSLTAAELALHMHPETRHLAEDVVRICAREGVSAEFVATLMRWERRPDLHNYFGWTDADGGLAAFASDTDCLEAVIPLIKAYYLTEGGRYYNGATVAGVNVFYNGSAYWHSAISGGMLDILHAAEAAA